MLWEKQNLHYTGSNNPNYKGGDVTVSCLYCSADVVLCRGTYNKKQKIGQKTFCSTTCHDDYRRKPKEKKMSMVGSGHPRWSGSKHCVICGDELIGSIARTRKSCSKKTCRSEIHNNHNTGKSHPRWVDKRFFCKQCGKEITGKRRTRKICCSRECAGKWIAANYSGKNSSLYKGNPRGKYPAEWTPSFTMSIRKENGYKCAMCGKVGYNLDVHHIDENKNNCHPDNLIVLCRVHHRHVHAGWITIG